jgi:adenylate kinase
MPRANPNIVVTGTPGVGKTTHCETLAERTGLRHVSINQIVKDKGCHEGWDEEYQSWIVDEDKVSPCHASSFSTLGGPLVFVSLPPLDVVTR